MDGINAAPWMASTAGPSCSVLTSTKWLLAALLLAFVLLSGATRVEAQSDEEYRVKAAFIYNFAKFVEWPSTSFPQPDTPMVVCTYGDELIVEPLRSIQGKTVGDRRIAVRVAESAEAIDGCHILFVNESDKTKLTRVLRKTKASGILSVSDNERFLEMGGTIEFVSIENKLRFEISLHNAKLSNLQISSKLLKLAQRVVE